MPPLPQFRGGSSVAFGPAPTPNVRPSNVGELISDAGRGLADVGMALAQKDDEDGRIWAAKTQTELRGKYNQRLMEAQNSGEDLNGLVTKIKTELDSDLQSARKAAPNRRGVYHLDLATPDFTTDVQGAAFGAEARYRVTKRVSDTEGIIEANRSQVFTNPSLFAKAYTETKALVDGLSLPIEAKARLQDQLQGMGSSAIQGMIENGNPYEAAKQLKSGAWNKYLDPDRLASLTNQAQGEISRRESEARARQAAQSSADAAMLTVRINQFANGQLDHIDQAEIDGLKGSLSPSGWATLQTSFDDARAKRAEADAGRIDIAARIDAGVGIDPGNTKQVKAFDDFFQKSVVPEINARAAQSTDPAGASSAMVLDFIKTQGIVPETLKAGLRTSLRSGSADEKAQAAAMVEQIKTVSPRALADIDDKTLSQANMLGAYIDGGATPEQAVRMTEEAMRTAKGNEAALKAEYAVLAKAEPTSDWLSSNFDESWWGSPTVPLTVATEFSAIAQNEFIRNGGNLEGARRNALDLAKKRYGASSVNGATAVVRNPIEQHYGVSWLTPAENAQAIKAEAVAEMSAGNLEGALSADRVRIEPHPEKGIVTPDNKPVYALQVQDTDGKWHVQMDMDPKSRTFGKPLPWAPALEKVKAARDRQVAWEIAAARGEVPEGAVVEGQAVYETMTEGVRKGRRRIIGKMVNGRFARAAFVEAQKN